MATSDGDRERARSSTRATSQARSTGCTCTTSWNTNVREFRNCASPARSSSCFASSTFANDCCDPATSSTAQYSACRPEPKHATLSFMAVRSTRTWADALLMTRLLIMVDAIAPAETRAQIRPARRGEQAPLAWIRLRSAPAQPPRSHRMCQDCEHPFIQWSIARLDERESDSYEQEEPCQCSSDWRRRNGQLIPDAVGGGGARPEGGHLPGRHAEKQGGPDIPVIWHLLPPSHRSQSSGGARCVPGGTDLRGQ